MSILYFAHPNDLGTPVVDLNGWVEGATSGFTLVKVEWGIDADVEFLSEGEMAGGEQIQVQHPPKLAKIELTAKGTDMVTLRDELYVPLAAVLNRAAVLVWQPDSYTEPFYFDTYRSSIPSMFEYVDKDGHFLGTGIDISYEFEVWQHPEPRQAGVEIASGTITNDTGAANVVDLLNPGTSYSEGRIALTVDGSEHVVWAMLGVKRGDLEFPSYTISSPETVTESWTRIHRQELTPSNATVFAGSYRVLATYTGDVDIYHFQCHSGSATNGPQGFTSDEFEHDWTDVNVFEQTILDLGTVAYDADDPMLVIEIWARSEEGSDVGSWGDVYLIPADEWVMELASPGFLSGHYGLERYNADELTLTGSPTVTDDGAVLLNTSGQSAFITTPGGTGRTLQLGRHNLEFRGVVKNKDRTRDKRGELQVYKNGGGSPDNKSSLFSRRGELVTRWDDDERRHVSWDVTDTDDVWKEGVKHTESTVVGRHITVERLRHTFIPHVTDGRAMVVDQGNRSSFIADDSGGRIADLHRTAALYWPPGNLTLAGLIGEQSPNAYDGVDSRGTLPVITAMSADVVCDSTPRHLSP